METNTMTDVEIAKAAHMHPFERANLGTAPFRCVGGYVSKFQAVPGDPSCPIQPGTSCDYCGQGIMNVFVVKGSDGRKFKVGSDCIDKAGKEAGTEHERVTIAIRKAVNKIKRDAKHATVDAKIEAARELFASVRGQLDPDTLRRVQFYLFSNQCGRAGKLKGAKLLADAVGALP
jgi:hypothetical protein